MWHLDGESKLTFLNHCLGWLISESLAGLGLRLLFGLSASRGQHGTCSGGIGWDGSRSLGTGCCRQDPSDSLNLGLICLFSGAIALCIHFAGVMERPPGKGSPVRGPGRQAAGLWTGTDQVWNLGQPEGGKKPRGQQGASCPETRTSHSCIWMKPGAVFPRDSRRGYLRLCWPLSPSLTDGDVMGKH